MNLNYRIEDFADGSKRYTCGLCGETYTSYNGIKYHLTGSKSNCARLDDGPPLELFEPLPSAPVDAVDAEAAMTAAQSGQALNQGLSFRPIPVKGAISGWRGWKVGRIDGDFRLFPMFQANKTPLAKGAVVAQCATSDDHPNNVPAEDCQCGFYAVWDVVDVPNFFVRDAQGPYVLGHVQAWGKVLPGKTGFRAEVIALEGVLVPICMWKTYEKKCDRPADMYSLNATWLQEYPSPEDESYYSHREFGDFATPDNLPLEGAFCDEHKPYIVPIELNTEVCQRKNGSSGTDNTCGHPASHQVGSRFYCPEHAPLVVGAKTVLSSVANYYGVYVETSRSK